MGLGIDINLPGSSRDSSSERARALERRLRASARKARSQSEAEFTASSARSRGKAQVYDRSGRASAIASEREYGPGERPPGAAAGPGPGSGPPGMAVGTSSTADLLHMPATEASLVQASIATSRKGGVQRMPPSPSAAPALTEPPPQSVTGVSVEIATAMATAPASSSQPAQVGLNAPVSVPRGAGPRELMRVAGALRQQLLQSSTPTVRDREVAALASKVEARARAMARAESQRRIALLSQTLEGPAPDVRVVRPEMEHILRYLDELSGSNPEGMSYYAEQKMQDLLVGVDVPSTDLKLLDEGVLDQINGVVLGELADESFSTQVTELTSALPAEDIFVDDGSTPSTS